MKKTEYLSIFDPHAIAKAHAIIRSGGLIAFPTDTIYGLACDPWNEQAILSIYEAKQRPPDKAIPVLIGDMHQLDLVASQINPRAAHIASLFWPGALTILLTKAESLPPVLSQYPSVGIRMPDHPALLVLLKTIGPLATTSANLSGSANLVSAEDVFAQFNGTLDLVLDGGETTGDMASTVVDCTGGELIILRQGPIAASELLSAWNDLAR
jgi:L-threonylcarbamoyladenylate synthase